MRTNNTRIRSWQASIRRASVVAFSLLLGSIHTVWATTYYVAKTGSNTNNGTSLTTPFLTIQKAADVAVAGDMIYVRAGTYRETVIPANSGTSGNPITYLPYNNEAVTISGAELVTGWSVHSGNIYKAALSGSFMDASHNQSDQIFIDGQMMHLAKWPNNANLDPSYPSKSLLTNFVSKTTTGNVTTGVFDDSNLPAGDYVGAEIYLQPNDHAWSWTLSGTVTNVSGTRITLQSYNGSGQDGNQSVYALNSRYYLYNKLSLLDAAGEWFHDKTANMLYLWCPGNSSPATKTVEAKKREYAFNLSDKGYIVVKGFSLFACTITTDDASGGSNVGYDASGNTIYPWRPAGSVASSNHCTIDGINAKFLSHYTDVSGHFYLQWGQSSGMVVSGSDHLIQNCQIQYSAGNGIALLGQRNKVLNNVITDVDYLANDCSAICTGGATTAEDMEIGYNTIARTGGSGMTPRSMINSNTSNLVARIHHNDISNYMLQDWDGGGIYAASGNQKFLRVDHNVVHDAVGYHVSGIYFDFTRNMIIDHNVVRNVDISIKLQGDDGGVNNSICYNNTLVARKTGEWDYGPFNFGNSSGDNNGTLAQNNICVYRDGSSMTASAGYSPFSPNFTGSTQTTNFLHAEGDPKFVDFATNNLQLQSTSAAINTGTLMGAVTRDGVSIPAYNDPVTGTVDRGAFEYGKPAWTAGATAVSDTQPPTAPTSLTASAITASSFLLSWAASTDDVGVTGYDVYKNGTLTGSATTTSLSLTGLTAATSYTMTVKAKDAAGNISVASSSLTVTTAPASATSIHIEAENYNNKSASPYSDGMAMNGLNTNDWLRFNNVNLTGQTFFKARLASPNVGGKIQIRLGSRTGTIIGTLTVSSTGSWTTYNEQSVGITPQTGIYTIFLTFTNAPYGCCNLDWIEFYGSGSGARLPAPRPTASAENTNLRVTLYPNPAPSGRFSLRVGDAPADEMMRVVITDLLGRSVTETTFAYSGTDPVFETGQLKPGLYIVTVYAGGKKQATKLLVGELSR